jgi:hypothetical protein
MNERAWSQSSDTFRPISTVAINETLSPGIYIPGLDLAGYYLTRYHEKYMFPYKIYGINHKFINRIGVSYQNTTGNLGVLLNGVKCTGKSVTAELLCNKFLEELGMPVILISSRIDGLPEFLASINQDIVIFIDEFEKIYKDENGRTNSTEILTIMDGALKSEHRRLFLFTTNKRIIDENLLERPGRIRYVKEFSDLSREVIEELVNDLLVHPARKKACIDFISKLQTITIDIVKAVITEVNIHDEDPSEFADVFNTCTTTDKINVYHGKLSAEKLMTTLPFISEGSGFNYNILTASPETKKAWAKNEATIYMNQPYTELGEFVSFENGILTVNEEYEKPGTDEYLTRPIEYTIEVVRPFHKSYSDYAF